jgi:hypothetical protein
MRTKLTLWINTALIVAGSLWVFVIPALTLIHDVRDPALARGGIPRFVFGWHRHLSAQFAPWARGTMKNGLGAQVGQFDIKGTEWPAHSAMLYLLATEELQKAWDQDHSLSPVAPKIYARESIDAAATLLMDPVNATWVRNFWGDDRYLKSQDVFFRMMVINGLTAHLALTGDQKYAEFLRGQADSLAAELDASPWGLLEDYPGQTYPVDIVPAVAGIQRIDHLLNSDHSAMIARAVRLLQGNVVETASGLPGYFVNRDTGKVLEPARGIGMSMTLVWSPQLWPEWSRENYALYVREFWQQDALLSGFREFRKGTGEKEWQDEVDAGPVIAGYGTSASAVGLAAACVNGDNARAHLLAMEAITAAWPLPDGDLPGTRVLSTPDAPYTGVCAVLFSLTRQAQSWSGSNFEHPEQTVPPPANERTPGFVFLFIGTGLAIGLLVLFAAIRRVMKPQRAMGAVAFGIWGAIMLAGAGLWFIHPWWAVLAWLAAQVFPREARRGKVMRENALKETAPAPSGA